MKHDVPAQDCDPDPVRERILDAAFNAFIEHGFAKASTLDIATRAKVSKRELYARFKTKSDLFAAGIAGRTRHMRFPLQLPDVSDRAGLSATLRSFGIALLSGVTDAHVIAIYRLAIGEAVLSPEVAKTLDARGRGQVRRALLGFLSTAQERGLIGPGDANTMGYVFSSLLLADTQLRIVLGVAKKPGPKDIARRAELATHLFMQLYAAP